MSQSINSYDIVDTWVSYTYWDQGYVDILALILAKIKIIYCEDQLSSGF